MGHIIRSFPVLGRRRKRGLRFLSLLFPGLLLFLAVPLAGQAALPGEALLNQAKDLIYSEAGTESMIEDLLDRARSAFEEIDAPALRSYSRGRAHLLLGTYHNSQQNKRRAAGELKEAIEQAEAALQIEEFSEGYRLLADAHSQMMMARGILYMARHGETARSAAFRSLELDPTNPRAHISVAGYYLNAPAIAGGDPEKGIETLERGISLEEGGPSERFLIYLWLAEAHQDLGRSAEALRYLAEARRIFPKSPQVAALAARISEE